MPTKLSTHVENAAQSMADDAKGNRAGAAAYTSKGSIRERRAKGAQRDFTSLNPKEAALIPEGWKPVWVRGSRYSEHEDRIAEMEGSLEDGGKEAIVIRKNEEFDFVTRGPSGDLVLMAIPPDIAEDETNFLQECNASFEEGMYPDSEKHGHAVAKDEKIHVATGAPYGELSPSDLRRMSLAEHEYNQKSGLTGGVTKGMDLFQATRFMKGKEAELAAEQARLRGGTQHTALDEKDFQKMMMGGERAIKMAFGDTGLGKTNAQRLAERGKGKGN